jgi:hypothetical protein
MLALIGNVSEETLNKFVLVFNSSLKFLLLGSSVIIDSNKFIPVGKISPLVDHALGTNTLLSVWMV